MRNGIVAECERDVVIVFSMPGSRRRLPLDCLPELMHAVERQPHILSKMLAQEFSQGQINQASVTGQCQVSSFKHPCEPVTFAIQTSHGDSLREMCDFSQDKLMYCVCQSQSFTCGNSTNTCPNLKMDTQFLRIPVHCITTHLLNHLNSLAVLWFFFYILNTACNIGSVWLKSPKIITWLTTLLVGCARGREVLVLT